MFIGESTSWIVYFLLNFDRQKFTRYLRKILGDRNAYRSLNTDSGSNYSSATNDTSSQAEQNEIETKREMSTKESIILSIPATFDLCGTTLMNIGLMYTPVSIYQMTRGALILFVAVFSVIFLKSRISRIEWGSLFIVTLGVTLVGLAGSRSSGGEASGDADSGSKNVSAILVVVGMFLILLAQVFTASQFVIEEHIMTKYKIIPLKLVGYEGVSGTTLTFSAMVLLHLFFGIRQPGSIYDMVTSFHQMFYSNPQVLFSSFLIMTSIACFNFFGISLTHHLSATSRSTIDTCRTLLVWIISMSLGWESFKFLQLVGFSLLVFGTLVFNGVIDIERYYGNKTAESRPLDVVDEQIERM